MKSGIMIDPFLREKLSLKRYRWFARFSAATAILIGIWVFYAGAFFYSNQQVAQCNYWWAWLISTSFFWILYIFFVRLVLIKTRTVHQPQQIGISQTPYKIIKILTLFEIFLTSAVIFFALVGIAALGVRCQLQKYMLLQRFLTTLIVV